MGGGRKGRSPPSFRSVGGNLLPTLRIVGGRFGKNPSHMGGEFSRIPRIRRNRGGSAPPPFRETLGGGKLEKIPSHMGGKILPVAKNFPLMRWGGDENFGEAFPLRNEVEVHPCLELVQYRSTFFYFV